jgi:recombination protein RecT
MSADEQTESAGKAVVKVLESESMRGKFTEALPRDIPVDRFTSVVKTGLNMRPELLEADRTSLYTACLSAAQDGLLPDGREGVLNIYNTNVGTKQAPKWMKKVQWMPMVEGVIKQLAKAGIKAYAASVYANDKIRIWNDNDGQHVEHEPVVFGDRGERIGAYAVGITQDGYTQVEALNMADLGKARAASKNKDGAIYELWADRMEQKTAMHRLRKRMAIMDPSVAEALRRAEEDDIDGGDGDAPAAVPTGSPPSSGGPGTATEPPRRSKTLQAVVDHETQTEAAPAAAEQPPPAGEFGDW